MKACAKINIFLKISGIRGFFHEIKSRFVKIEELYDEIFFVKKNSDEFIINDNFENNIIKKAFVELKNAGFKNELDEFFKTHQVKLIKNIPIGAGLGGGSSDAGVFLRLINEELNLKISRSKLIEISSKIGSDVAFFASDFNSANVSGVGEIIEEFNDDIPKIELIFSKIFCSTPLVYKKFDEISSVLNDDLSKVLLKTKSKDILQQYQNYELNDLLKPCLDLYHELSIKDGEFLSGSGSTKFKCI